MMHQRDRRGHASHIRGSRKSIWPFKPRPMRLNAAAARLRAHGLQLFVELTDSMLSGGNFRKSRTHWHWQSFAARRHHACAGAVFRPHLELSPWMLAGGVDMAIVTKPSDEFLILSQTCTRMVYFGTRSNTSNEDHSATE
jgi:hypothetical protein